MECCSKRNGRGSNRPLVITFESGRAVWGDLFLFAEDEARLGAMLGRLCEDAKARAAFLVDQNGRLIAASGDRAGLDTTALASLVAGSIAATGSLARLIGEQAFSGLFHEGERSHLYLTVLGDGLILAVSYRTSSAGLVRCRVKRASEEIGQVFAEITGRVAGFQSEIARITDEDIENLLSS